MTDELESSEISGRFHYVDKRTGKLAMFKLTCKKEEGESPQQALFRLATLAKKVLQRRREEGG